MNSPVQDKTGAQTIEDMAKLIVEQNRSLLKALGKEKEESSEEATVDKKEQAE